MKLKEGLTKNAILIQPFITWKKKTWPQHKSENFVIKGSVEKHVTSVTILFLKKKRKKKKSKLVNFHPLDQPPADRELKISIVK